MAKKITNMDENYIKHLEFIQDVITRMNSNSFSIKEWAITVMAALLALYASSANALYIFVAIIPTIMFWFLDAYYLQQERKFRGVYNDVIKKENNIPLFTMPINNYKGGVYSYYSAFKSKTIAWFYGTITVLLLLIGVFLKLKDYITINC